MADEAVCLWCELPSCDESSPDCGYQNQLPERTVAAVVQVPVQIARQRAKWAANARRQKERRAQNTQESIRGL